MRFAHCTGFERLFSAIISPEIIFQKIVSFRGQEESKYEDENFNYNHRINGSRFCGLWKYDAEFEHGNQSTEQQPGRCGQ